MIGKAMHVIRKPVNHANWDGMGLVRIISHFKLLRRAFNGMGLSGKWPTGMGLNGMG
jgi:hypothetical protein